MEAIEKNWVLILLGICLLSVPAFAERVVMVSEDNNKVAVTHSPGSTWRENEQLCVYGDGQQLGCGRVIKTTPKIAILELHSKTEPIYKGDTVRLASAEEITERHPSSISTLQIGPTSRNFSSALSAGVNVVFPAIHYQYFIGENYSIGVMANSYIYDIDGVNSKSAGGLLTVSYYPTLPLEGLQAIFGVGFHAAKIEFSGVEKTVGSFTTLAAIGWRWFIGNEWNLGVAGGAQWFLTDRDDSVLPFRFSVLMPSVLVDFGITF